MVEGIDFLIAPSQLRIGAPQETALFLDRAVSLMARLRRSMGMVERVTGALLVAVGLMMLTGAFSGLSYWLLETFPALATIG